MGTAFDAPKASTKRLSFAALGFFAPADADAAATIWTSCASAPPTTPPPTPPPAAPWPASSGPASAAAEAAAGDASPPGSIWMSAADAEGLTEGGD